MKPDHFSLVRENKNLWTCTSILPEPFVMAPLNYSKHYGAQKHFNLHLQFYIAACFVGGRWVYNIRQAYASRRGGSWWI